MSSSGRSESGTGLLPDEVVAQDQIAKRATSRMRAATRCTRLAPTAAVAVAAEPPTPSTPDTVRSPKIRRLFVANATNDVLSSS